MQVQALEQTFVNFLVLGKSRFYPKMFYNIYSWPKNNTDNDEDLYETFLSFLLSVASLLKRQITTLESH